MQLQLSLPRVSNLVIIALNKVDDCEILQQI